MTTSAVEPPRRMEGVTSSIHAPVENVGPREISSGPLIGTLPAQRHADG
jgi:hypothetical protein